jgi:hypothetical protein
MIKSLLAGSICLAAATALSQIPQNGLMGDWPFDGNANDYSGNGNNGIVMGATPTTDRFGNANHAYKFDGFTSRIVVPTSSTVDMSNTSDFTIAMWIKSYPGNHDALPLCKNDWGHWSGYLFWANNHANNGYCNSPQHVSFYSAASSQGDAFSDSTLLNDTLWHFVTGVYAYATNKTFLYVNAVQQQDVGTASGNRSVPTYDLSFGSHTNGIDNFFNGCLDGIRIYDRVLTQGEIDTLYHEGNPVVNGIRAVTDAINIQVYPNPANSLFKLSYSSTSNEPANIEVFNATSQLVYSESKKTATGNNVASIDLSSQAEGVYYLKLRSGNAIATKRIVLMK